MSNIAGEPASASDEPYRRNSWTETEQHSMPQGSRRLRRYVAVMLVLTVLVGAAYASFVAQHNFSYPSSSAPIINKNLTYNFTANEQQPVLAVCTSTPPPTPPCSFNVAGTGTVAVTATTSTLSGTGVTVTLIQASPLSIPCSATPPTTGTGVVAIPLPGNTALVNFNGGKDYNYCIYYTSVASITGGTFSVDYSA